MYNDRPSREEMFLMVARMQRYGGSFVQALAECFIHADQDNLDRLYRAFPEYVKEYTKVTP